MDCNYVQEAAEYVRARIGETPRIGLILGSGLGYLGDEVELPTSMSSPTAKFPT